MIKWLLAPSKIPNAPSWSTVFLFGILWNTVVVQCNWAAIGCTIACILLRLINK